MSCVCKVDRCGTLVAQIHLGILDKRVGTIAEAEYLDADSRRSPTHGCCARPTGGVAVEGHAPHLQVQTDGQREAAGAEGGYLSDVATVHGALRKPSRYPAGGNVQLHLLLPLGHELLVQLERAIRTRRLEGHRRVAHGCGDGPDDGHVQQVPGDEHLDPCLLGQGHEGHQQDRVKEGGMVRDDHGWSARGTEGGPKFFQAFYVQSHPERAEHRHSPHEAGEDQHGLLAQTSRAHGLHRPREDAELRYEEGWQGEQNQQQVEAEDRDVHLQAHGDQCR
mmetsp:Transcript_102014/g.324163  ORF Transcript_102014/g.324163 Transcript_102014/m.324163 type:complete len:278 (-) Transcript_102014:47-880(-)